MKAYTKGRQFYTKTITKLNRSTYAAKDDANDKSPERTIIINQWLSKSKYTINQWLQSKINN